MGNCNTIFNCKRFIKKALYYSGFSFLFVNLLYFIAYYFHSKPGTIILCYHSINDLDNEMIFKPNIVETENFIKQMKYLKKRYNVISLEHFIENYRKLTGSRNVVITFDDGYKDNFTNAYPVLKKYKLPATLFLSTDFIDTGKTKFEDKITYSFFKKNISTIDISDLNLKKTVTTTNERNSVIAKICYSINKLDDDKKQDIINDLYKRYAIGVNLENIILTWDEIKQMDRHLVSFESHSVSHRNLTRLSHDQQIKEINESKKIIEQQLGTEVAGFSYPLGFFDSNVIRLVKEAGYKYALTIIPGINNYGMDLFKLKRTVAVNNFHLFKFRMFCQSGTLYNVYSKLVSIFSE